MNPTLDRSREKISESSPQKKGSYIFNSLVVVLAAYFFIWSVPTYGGAGYRSCFSPTIITGMLAGKSAIGTLLRSPQPTDNPAAWNAIYSGSFLQSSDAFGKTKYISVQARPILWSQSCTSIPAAANASEISDANLIAPTSLGAVMQTAPTFPRSVCRISNCSFDNERGAILASSSTRAKSAFEARSIASPAASVAASSLAFDRFRSSVWMRLFHIVPSVISPTMPKATAASAIAGPHISKVESYGGWQIARKNSAITPTTTNAANHTPHRSQEDDASSSWLSAAFIIPFGSHHAGQNGFRDFLFAFAVWSLIFAILFSVLWFVE